MIQKVCQRYGLNKTAQQPCQYLQRHTAVEEKFIKHFGPIRVRLKLTSVAGNRSIGPLAYNRGSLCFAALNRSREFIL